MEKGLYERQVEILLEKWNTAETIVVGAGSGMSMASELPYTLGGELDNTYDPDGRRHSLWPLVETVLECGTGGTYAALRELLAERNYHILTTNQDAQFHRVFPEERISAIQGDMRYLQCGIGCHDQLYEALPEVRKMKAERKKGTGPSSEYVPLCPVCGARMEPWVRSFTFLEGDKYHGEHRKLAGFLGLNQDRRLLFLELGVGRTTPGLIREPFWKMAYNWPNAYYISVNIQKTELPDFLQEKGLVIWEDIGRVLADMRGRLNTGGH